MSEININITIDSAVPSTKRNAAIIILDKSGSMGSMQDAAINGFNEFVGDTAYGDAETTVVQFSSSVNPIAPTVAAKLIAPLDRNTYAPSGMTALYDAVGQALAIAKQRYTKEDKVLFLIVTDGGENSSEEYTAAQVKAQIGECERLGWAFLFIGNGADSWSNATNMGIATSANISTQSGAPSLIRSMDVATRSRDNYYNSRVSNVGIVAETLQKDFADEDNSWTKANKGS